MRKNGHAIFSQIPADIQWRRERGTGGTFPSPETEKIFVENLNYVPPVNTSEKMQRSQKNLQKIYDNSQFHIETLIRESQNIVILFQMFDLFWSKLAKPFMLVYSNSLTDGNYSSTVDYLVHSSKLLSISSKTFNNFHSFNNIPPRSKIFLFFDRLLN